MSIKIRKKVLMLENDMTSTSTPKRQALQGIKINQNVKKDIGKIWDGIIKRINDTRPENLYKHGIEKFFPNVAQINEIEVTDEETGEKTTVRPRQLAELTKYLIGKMVGDSQLQIFAKYFDKPLIYTFAVPTACTDGVRIAVNPLFLDKILTKEMEETKGNLNGHFIMYVLMHEIYHCVYQHFRRAKIKKETNTPNKKIQELVNIAQDAEINRDLEYQFPEKFKGKTVAIGGVLDEHFKHEAWEDIFDAYYYGKVEPPERENNQPQMGSGNGNPKQKGQQNQQNQQNQQGGDEQDPFEGRSPEYVEGFKHALECIENGTLDPLNWDMRVRYKPGFEPASNFITNYRTKGALGKKTLAAQVANMENNDQGSPAGMDDLQDVFGNAVDDGSKTFGEQLEESWGTYEEGFTDAVKAVAQAINDLMNGQTQQGGGGSNNKMPIRIPEKYLPKQARQQLQQQMQQNQQGCGGQSGSQSGQDQQGGGGGGSDSANAQAGSKAMGNGAGHFKNNQNGQQNQDGSGGSQDQGQQQGDNGEEQQGQGSGNGEEQDQQNQQGQGGGQGQKNQQTYNKDDFEGGATTRGTDHFGGNDIISQQDMQRIAEEAGQPYDTDDLAADPIEKAKDFFEKQKQAMKDLGQRGGKQAGSGNGLDSLVDRIEELFKSEIDWRSKLKKFFNGVVESEVKHTYQKRRIGSSNVLVHKSRYIKYNEETDLINDGIAQVFYLVDDSGSMFTGKKTASGEDYVFTKIFSEIIALEKKTKIHDSMLTYFSTTIVKDKIRHWTGKDNSHKILRLIRRHNDISGGTDIVGCMGAVIKLGKPYYRKEEPQTLMIVISDGYDDLESAAKFEMKYKRKVIWLLINDSPEHRKQQKERLKAGGYSEERILEIDTGSYKKDMR